MTASSSFGDARAATEQAAAVLDTTNLGWADSVSDAWDAVGVDSPPDYTTIDTQGPLAGATDTEWTYIYDASAYTAMKFTTSGGTGDADLYVKLGSAPSASDYHCGSFSPTTEATSEINPSGQGS